MNLVVFIQEDDTDGKTQMAGVIRIVDEEEVEF